MEQWNREELYADVWEHPLTKLATKYGTSAVAIGKVCRKLKIPLPGRGYWAKKEFGKPVKRIPLPAAKDLPIVEHVKFPPPEGADFQKPPEPTDPEWMRIKEMESRTIPIPAVPKFNKLVTAALRNLSSTKTDERGLLIPRAGTPVLDVRVSKMTLDRALKFLNTVIDALEAEGFSTEVTEGHHGTAARVFGHRVQFGIVEKLNEMGRREVKEYGWTKTVIDYEPSGRLEFRVGEFAYAPRRHVRDGKKQRLEDVVALAVGAVMREGRELRIEAERRAQEEIARQERARERMKLADQIREEEKNVQQLDTWVDTWHRAEQIRAFVRRLEEVWTAEGLDLSPQTPKGQRVIWMKQQADRLDPFIATKPASILDRKRELSGW